MLNGKRPRLLSELADVHDRATRSRNMAAIRGSDTKPEMIVRKGLHVHGFRYRLHDKKLPGRPDLVLPKHRAVIFVNGCFWHGHHCELFRWPSTREEFWREKITANVERDRRNAALLTKAGWRIGVVWECSLKGKNRLSAETVVQALADWLLSHRRDFSVSAGSVDRECSAHNKLVYRTGQ